MSISLGLQSIVPVIQKSPAPVKSKKLPWDKQKLAQWLEEELVEITEDIDECDTLLILRGRCKKEQDYRIKPAKARYRLGMQLLRMVENGHFNPPYGSPAWEALENPNGSSGRILLYRVYDVAFHKMRGPGSDWDRAVASPPGKENVERDDKERLKDPSYRYVYGDAHPDDEKFTDDMEKAIVDKEGPQPKIEPKTESEPEPEPQAKEEDLPKPKPRRKRRKQRGDVTPIVEFQEKEEVPNRITTLISMQPFDQNEVVNIINRILADFDIPDRIKDLLQPVAFTSKGNTGNHGFYQIDSRTALGIVKGGTIGDPTWVVIRIYMDSTGNHRIKFNGTQWTNKKVNGAFNYDQRTRRWR